jgi:DNA invertase Pin-like site-specific DNA recombinase
VQDLDRQVDALTTAGIPAERIYLDRKSGAATDRPGLRVLLDYARSGDVIVHTLDRLGRTVRETLNLIHELAERGVGVRNLADPIRVDSSNPADPMAQFAVVLLALFGQMERTYTLERAAHARAVATAKGRRVGRPVTVDRAQLDYAAHLRAAGRTIAEIVAKTGIPRGPACIGICRPGQLSRSPPAHGSASAACPSEQPAGEFPGRRRHPKKDVEAALRYAEAANRRMVEVHRAHRWEAASVPCR